MRIALVQLSASDDPQDNVATTGALIARAADEGARFILTPEVTNCVSTSRTQQAEVLSTEAEDVTLAALRDLAARHGAHVLIGSLALKAEDGGKFVNRSFLIGPDGGILTRYDKIHMFDVEVSPTETYRESDGYAPGSVATVSDVLGTPVGLTICYDLRFPALYRTLAQAGAAIIAVPSAFSPATGPPHWEVLLRARAVETGTYILAPAQCGDHARTRGRARSSHGHSLAVAPWGEVLADAGTSPGVTVVDLDLAAVGEARRRIPSLAHDHRYEMAS